MNKDGNKAMKKTDGQKGRKESKNHSEIKKLSTSAQGDSAYRTGTWRSAVLLCDELSPILLEKCLE
jgi:hypothetical protein